MSKDTAEAPKRTIVTQYTLRNKPVQVTRSANANRAVMRCVGHMQVNQYGASVAQIHDLVTGELHAEVKRSVEGNIKITFERNPRDFVTPGTLEHFKNRSK